MRRAVLVLVAVAVTLASPTTADAQRRPTRHEQRVFDRLTGLPAGCAYVRLSTVSARWAGFQGANVRKKRCRPWASNGITLYRKRGGEWRRITAGSAFMCPIRRVPLSVAYDLRACVSERLEPERGRMTAMEAAQPFAAQVTAAFGVPAVPSLVGCVRDAAWQMYCDVDVSYYADAGTNADAPSDGDIVCSEVGVEVTAKPPGKVLVSLNVASFEDLGCARRGP